MATVRIYKVAELLGSTSQEVLALLKRDHGIELKSASSTVEEVVARSFVERVARQRNISIPSGDIFAETAAAPAKGATAKKVAPPKKAEPPKAAAPVLGPPRLIKTIKPAAQPTAEDAGRGRAGAREPVAEEPVEEVAPPSPLVEPSRRPEPVAEVIPEPVPVAAAPMAVEEVIEPPAPPREAPAPTACASRVVPPMLRLRIEEPGRPAAARASADAGETAGRLTARMVQPPSATPPAAKPTTPAGGRPGAPGAPRPGAPRPGAPGGPRPAYPPPLRPTTPSMLGGPRPLPSQPVRTQTPGAPPRPGMPGQRPPLPPASAVRRPAASARPAAGHDASRAPVGPDDLRHRRRRRRSRGRSRSPKA